MPSPVEWIVGAFIVLGLIAVVIRFLPRDAAGVVVLPRIVNDSIGMYLLRRATGRRLGERAEFWFDQTGERGWFGRDVGVRRAEPEPLRRRVPTAPGPAAPVSSPLAAAPREPGRPRSSAALRTLAAVVAVAALGFGVGVALGQAGHQGEVLGATGTPQRSQPSPSAPGPTSP
jgi:hypothetical protein